MYIITAGMLYVFILRRRLIKCVFRTAFGFTVRRTVTNTIIDELAVLLTPLRLSKAGYRNAGAARAPSAARPA